MCGLYKYDLDYIPVEIKKWNELSNVKVYYDFFKKRENEFVSNN